MHLHQSFCLMDLLHYKSMQSACTSAAAMLAQQTVHSPVSHGLTSIMVTVTCLCMQYCHTVGGAAIFACLLADCSMWRSQLLPMPLGLSLLPLA